MPKKGSASAAAAASDLSDDDDSSKPNTTRSGLHREYRQIELKRKHGRSKDLASSASYAAQSTNPRKSMGDAVTTDLVKSIPADSFAASVSRDVAPLVLVEPAKASKPPEPVPPPKRGRGQRGGKKRNKRKAPDDKQRPQLKAVNVSRNHILADSWIRNVLEEIYRNRRPSAAAAAASDVLGDDNATVKELFLALAGDDAGAPLFERFKDVLQSRERAKFDDVMHETSEGRVNLRLGLADINTKLSNSFDPIIVNGKLDKRSARIRDAALALASRGLIKWKTAIDATSAAMDKVTGHYVTSTVLKSETRTSETGSRASIDPFARPADPAEFRRSNSAPSETRWRQNKKVRPNEPAREFHHPSRPATALTASAANTDLAKPASATATPGLSAAGLPASALSDADPAPSVLHGLGSAQVDEDL